MLELMPLELVGEILRDPLAVTGTLPWEGLVLLILVSAWIEFVFPPYPGDTILMLGFFLAARGAGSWQVLYICAVIGSTLGAMTVYALGRSIGLDPFLRVLNRRRQKIQYEDLERLLGRFGSRALLLNRFMPVVRGFLLPAAGALRLGVARVTLLALISNVLFVTFLLGLGTLGADSWEQMVGQARDVKRVLGGALLVAFGVWWWRRRRARS